MNRLGEEKISWDSGFISGCSGVCTGPSFESAANRARPHASRKSVGSAAALSVSVSRHLVSASVQFGQSAAGKTESDQWLLIAHLSGAEMCGGQTGLLLWLSLLRLSR